MLFKHIRSHILYSFVILTCLIRPVQAHPHAWIDLKSSILLNEDGKVSGIRVGWLFDDFYTAYALEGMNRDGNGMPDQIFLDKLAEENLHNLELYNYFLDFKVNGKTQAYQSVDNFTTSIEGSRLWLEYIVPLTTPVDPKSVIVSYSIYDPTYYVEILHTQEMPVTIKGSGADTCHYSLNAPDPSNEARLFASSLDATESGGNSIGRIFAETVKISCI